MLLRRGLLRSSVLTTRLPSVSVLMVASTMWAWPGGTVRYICNKCRFVASGADGFSKKCEGRVAVRRRTKEIESLREFATGKGAAHDQRAAKRILDYLGFDAHQKKDVGLAALAKGLRGTGVADGQP